MKVRTYGFLFVAALGVLAAPQAFGQSDCTLAAPVGDFFNPSTAILPPEVFVSTRADLSNPGARALALGGAFIATADDSTSVVANPAGLGASVRPGAQIEVRYSPTVQYDRFAETGLLDPTAPGDFTQDEASYPYFVSGVVPVGDKLVLGAFYQTVFNSDRTANRVPGSDRTSSGPCYATVDFRGTDRTVLVPLYRLQDETSIFRTGVSAAFRAAPGFAVGATVYYAGENRDQTYLLGDASGATYQDPANIPGTVKLEESGFGYELGLQYSPSETFRVGLVWSSEVAFGKENTTYNGTNVQVQNAFRGTVIPMRAGLGFSWAFHPRWSLGFDTVYLATSAEKDEISFDDPRPLQATMNPDYWKQDDTWEFRAGLEWIAVQTRTTSVSARFGGWVQTPSDLRFDASGASPSPSDRYFFDALSVIFPAEKDDPFTHATFGLGLVSQKKWQIDVGFDYEFKTETFVASGLLGYTF